MTTTKTNFVESFPSYIPDEGNPWIPWDEPSKTDIKIVKLNPSNGEMTVFMRTPPGGTLTKHFHPGTVHVYVVQGEWTYGEGWVAKPGDVVVESAGSTHAPTMVGSEPTIIFAIIQGALMFVDDEGNTIGYENWQTLLKLYLDYCDANGIAPRDDLTCW
jgi:2,4'-dihydroxyacetophenone dioxygenase